MVLGIGIVSFTSIYENATDSYYHTVESSLLLSGSDYFQDHRELLSANTYSKVSIKDLMDENYTEDVKDKNGNLCVNGEVIAHKGENNQYQYEVCLKCGDYESSGTYCDGYNSEDNRYRVPTNALCKARNKVTYEIKATLNSDEYYWSDDTQGPKYFYCKLYKKTPTITIEPYEGTVVVGAETDFIEKSEISGTFTNVSEDVTVARVNHEERVIDTKNKVFVSGMTKDRSTNIDITFEPGESYKY